MDNMQRFVHEFLHNKRGTVLDIGGADINGSYKRLFDPDRFAYIAADMAPAPGVALVMHDPYRIPLDSDSMDILISGQAFEHCPYFWLLFSEMVRVCKPGGLICIIAPSEGPIHRFPVDCYRFCPDSFAALAEYAKCEAVKIHHDERPPWRDLVGVFRKP
jgi:SAM-dependent methyltransferase